MQSFLVSFYQEPGQLTDTYVMQSDLTASELQYDLNDASYYNHTQEIYPDCEFVVEPIAA